MTHPPMTPDTVEFFARDDVRSFVEEVRRLHPKARFCLNEAGVHPCGSLWGVVDAGTHWGYFCLCPKHARDRDRALSLDNYGLGAEHYEQAIREGRALLEDLSPPTGAGTPSEVPQPSPSAPVVRVVCSCGQEIRRKPFAAIHKDDRARCGDCITMAHKALTALPDIDERIAAARKTEPDPTSDWGAGATPSYEWEEWR